MMVYIICGCCVVMRVLVYCSRCEISPVHQKETYLIISESSHSSKDFSQPSRFFQALAMSVTLLPSEGRYAGRLDRRSFVCGKMQCVSLLDLEFHNCNNWECKFILKKFIIIYFTQLMWQVYLKYSNLLMDNESSYYASTEGGSVTPAVC